MCDLQIDFLFEYIILLISAFWICPQVVWFNIIKTNQILDTWICQLSRPQIFQWQAGKFPMEH